MTPEQTGTETLDLQELLRVLRALRDGDLSQRMPSGQSGVAGEIAATLNATFDQFYAFASEVTRIMREVATDGKLGGQAHVPGAAGTWKDLTDIVNLMASTMTVQIRHMARGINAFAQGNTSHRVPLDARGEMLEYQELVNFLGDRLSSRSPS